VLALEVVTATGEVVRVGRRTAKGVVGYDLAGLMVGSEGTLGIVTEVTVKLRPARPAAPRTVVGFFDSLAAAGAAVAAVTASRAAARGVRAGRPGVPGRGQRVEATPGLPTGAAALLLAQTDLPEPAAQAEADAILAAFTGARGERRDGLDRRTEAEALFDARRLAYPALEQLGMGMLTEDVCVPPGGWPRCSRGSRRSAPSHARPDRDRRPRRRRQPAPAAAHPARRRRPPAAARAAFDEIIDAALELGGTVTGEHGVGLLKRDGPWSASSARTVLAMHRAVKAALDPDGILNPGKAV
jgi:glycolate oxidase